MNKIMIEDGTIENPRHDTHRRAKNWVAIVERDKSQPGGLRRTFLERAPAGRVHVAGISAGCWLEFAGDYYSASGRKQANRTYVRVHEISDTAMTIEECSHDNVGKQIEAALVNPLAAYSDDELLAEVARRGLTH